MTDVDVLIAGAGGAGVTAAIAAARAGSSVLVVELDPDHATHSNTALSTAMIPAAGSRWQSAEGIDDSPAIFRDDIAAKTNGHADPIVTDVLVSVGAELVTWLADDCAVPLELVTDFVYPGHTRARCHAVADRSGRTLLAYLLQSMRTTDATLLTPAQLTAAEPASSGWTCEVSTPDGATERISATSVVLASNGYGARPDLVAQYLPAMSDALYFGGPGSIGTAIDLGEALAADLACLDAYQGHGSVAVPHGILTTWATVMHGAVIVNRDGVRFGDETTGYSEYAELVLAQPGRDAWVILDSRIDALCRPFADYQLLLAERAIHWADSAVDLAARIGIEPAAFAATLQQLPLASGAPDPLGRTFWESALSSPLGAVHVTGALFHTQGGLRIDEQARVLRGGEPISGLFAAGGAAVGMSGHGADGYLAGNGLLAALGLGLVAGRAAAERRVVTATGGAP